MNFDNLYNGLKWKRINPTEAELNNMLCCSEILRTTVIDYPLTDEVCMFFENCEGDLFALSTGMDPFAKTPEYYIQIAEVPSEYADMIRQGL